MKKIELTLDVRTRQNKSDSFGRILGGFHQLFYGPFKTYGKQAFTPEVPGQTEAQIDAAAAREG